jgi:ribosomal protein L17
MRHRVKKHKRLSQKDACHRKAVIRNLLTSLFTHKSLQTTEKRALAIEPLAHRLIEVAKGDHTEYNKIRLIASELFTKEASVSLMSLAKNYATQK